MLISNGSRQCVLKLKEFAEGTLRTLLIAYKEDETLSDKSEK